MYFDNFIYSIPGICIILPNLLLPLSYTVLDDAEPSSLSTADSLRPSPFEVSRNFKIFGCSSHQIYDIAAQYHFLLSEALPEELI